ncbi:hypothetical protein Godav_011260 [Gossypium davidsonii]|uniref:Uncharacterized protein n=2 Tax=Gossypium TaxID=3633 RepID=A0A7J8RA26_GOSDV|nr:hypothetical protein [Gossypium davidsonii]MBA0645495.1 hypothetical protein [Gossypium klotzschianum]
MTINMKLMFHWMRWMSWLHNRNRRSQTKMIPHFQRRKKRLLISQKCSFKKMPKNYIWPYVK